MRIEIDSVGFDGEKISGFIALTSELNMSRNYARNAMLKLKLMLKIMKLG